jgi:hypothetical protein
MTPIFLKITFTGLLFFGAALPTMAQNTGGFENEKVETRPFRNPDVERGAEERSGRDHGQSHKGHNHKRHDHKGHDHKSHERDRKGNDHKGHRHEKHGHNQHPDDHGIETESLYGFTLGSDTENAGATGMAVETVSRWAKRSDQYSAIGTKLEFAYGVTDNLSISLGLLGDYHSVKKKPETAAAIAQNAIDNGEDPDEAVRDGRVKSRFIFNGFGGEMRYRFLDRKASAFGMTLHLEPVIAFSDEASGIRGTKYGSENKLIFDQEILPDRLFVAFNILHEMEVVKEKGSEAWERGSRIGASLAATYQIMPKIFLGAEMRYLRGYEGLNLKTYTGDGLYVGPTLYARMGEAFWVSTAWNTLVGGHAKGVSGQPNLDDFERHNLRLKVGMEF